MLTSERRWLRFRWLLPRPVGGGYTRRHRSRVHAAAALGGELLLLVVLGGREEWSSLAASSFERSGVAVGPACAGAPRRRSTRVAALYPSGRTDAPLLREARQIVVGVLP